MTDPFVFTQGAVTHGEQSFPFRAPVLRCGVHLVPIESVCCLNCLLYSGSCSCQDKTRHMRLSLFGAITITAPNLPYALVLLSWALNSSWSAVVGDLLGIAVGHVYYFFTFVWANEVSSDKTWVTCSYRDPRFQER